MAKGPVLTRGGYTAPITQTLVDISADADLTPAINITEASFGGLLIPATVNGTSILFHVSDTESGTYYALTDASNVAIGITCSSGTASAHPLPPELFGFNWFKIETATDQADTDTQFTVVLKG